MYFTILVCLLPMFAFATQPCNEAHDAYDSAMNNAGRPLLGAEEPRCDDNGEYADRICSGTDCWCVKPNGEEIENYHHRRWEITESLMDCKCARKAKAYFETGLIGLFYRCTKEGAFESQQCTGSMCYCADSNGEQVGESVSITEISSLNC